MNSRNIAIINLGFLAEQKETKLMVVQFFLFIIIVLLISIFWELSKINTRLKKALTPR